MEKKYFYKIVILKINSPELTYHSYKKLEIGSIVKVTLINHLRDGVVVEMVEEPNFETLEIKSVDEKLIFRESQLEIAKFISYYYFSTYGEALSIFHPYSKTVYKNGDNFLLNENKDIEFKNITPTLSKEQKEAYLKLSEKELALLFGVTGSGKTEIYITQIDKKLRYGKSSIILMPEISLTPQIKKRLEKYFGDKVAIWHSKLSKKEREKTLQRIREGEIKVLAGARSALFLPISNLGFIVVDEEHDDSYKSMTKPRYNARDLATYIGKKYNIQVWLCSATPSLTSYLKYPIVKLKKPFVTKKKVFKFISGNQISGEIIEHIKRNFQKGEQSLLFVPIKANFKNLYCPACGEIYKCPFCSVGMSLDSWKRYLKCNYCNYIEEIKDSCESCGYSPLTSNRFGTQEVVEIIKREIPDIRIELFDTNVITTSRKLHNALKRVENGKIDLLVGTQMLTKGHDYPNITLSIITGLDYILGISDYRAKERAVALMHQIAGRSGRKKDATVLIQTAQKEFFAPYILDYEIFLKDEVDFVEDLYPPFMRLARVLINDKKQDKVKKSTEIVVEMLKEFDTIEIVGFGEAPVKKIANRYRYHIILRAKKKRELLNALYKIKGREKKIEIDMDPVDFS